MDNKTGEYIRTAINQWCEKNLDDGRRSHLGASELGDPCSRKLWYKFRWCGKQAVFDGRMLRLFKRGHNEEPNFISYLRGIGAFVWDKQDNGEQYGFTDCEGHCGGHCDGIAIIPETYLRLEPYEPVLCEFKTQGTGKGFTDLVKKGVKLAKPQHYAQMCIYGHKLGLRFAVYMVVNKNDDDLYVETVQLDNTYGNDLINKACTIINSQIPPNKLSESPAFFSCKFCEFNEICHYEAPAEKNCRSCTKCIPDADAQWKCQLYNNIIPKDFIPTGCDNWSSILE
jgi:hypothetical protein